MADEVELNSFYEKITGICEDYFKSDDVKTAWDLAEYCMDIEGIPMHHPAHHYIVPAVLLAVCHRGQGSGIEQFRDDLEIASTRAKNVLPGFCGWYGACGCCVGVGIFMSVYTKTDPHSKESWSWANRSTAEALLKISEYTGPQCCKRNTYLALESAEKIIAEFLKMDIEHPAEVRCKYNKGNKNCKGRKCPFFVARTA